MIKRLLTISMLSVSLFGTAQQLPNNGFENWTSGNPNSWGSFDEMLSGLGVTGTTLETQVSPGNSGTSACQLMTQTVLLLQTTVPGVINSGPITYGSQVDFALSPYSGTPTDYTFSYKFSPVSGDTAGTQVVFTKWNSATNTRDTIAYGGDLIVGAANNFTLRSVPITWLVTGVAPDSVSMIFLSSAGFVAQPNTKFIVDDVNMVFPLGITEPFMLNDIAVFPNPATDIVNFSSKNHAASLVEIFDFSGKLVISQEIENGNSSVNTTAFAPGVYMYRIMDVNGNEIKSSKFSVAK
jgi:hypothetical protein